MTKLITCILPHGQGNALTKTLFELGHTRVFCSHARGFDIRAEPVSYTRIPIAEQKEMLTVVVPAEEADDLFELIFNKANINQLGGGFIFMRSLSNATNYQVE